MPHASSMPTSGFQALILCGPGNALANLSSSQDEFPKALMPIANRPMVWYPLEWCYRMGITSLPSSLDRGKSIADILPDILLITPPSSAAAINLAISTNRHLTSLPAPKPSIIAPLGLNTNSGTSEIFRLPEVQESITGDFIVLPCDLVCELGGDALLASWMMLQSGIGGDQGSQESRRGGLGIWYQTGGDSGVKNEETDFIITSKLPPKIMPMNAGSLLPSISNLVYSIPTSTLKENIEEKKGLLLRRSLITSHSNLRMLTKYRDAHIYFFPFWVLDMIRQNDSMESISEDVLGLWAKSGWQNHLGDKMGSRGTLQGGPEKSIEDISDALHEINLSKITSTSTSSQLGIHRPQIRQYPRASPPILAYIHPSNPQAAFIRRADTAQLLLQVSLRLARIESIDSQSRAGASPFAHQSKIANPAGVALRCTVTKPDCLLAEHVIVKEKAVIKESVIGSSCEIGLGSRLTRCLLMDGVIVGDHCQLNGCIIGQRSRIGSGSILKDCEVREGFLVPDKSNEKDYRFDVLQGLEEGDVLSEDEGRSGQGAAS
ncbi:MAG: hypothetical protein M1829_000606 [Trizodia sp. TS-e1964]|nr:MAG: hypothetical protein M1829_000606 [Trizodia sp. TS-e1964]